jgi:hypothetical protein
MYMGQAFLQKHHYSQKELTMSVRHNLKETSPLFLRELDWQRRLHIFPIVFLKMWQLGFKKADNLKGLKVQLSKGLDIW